MLNFKKILGAAGLAALLSGCAARSGAERISIFYIPLIPVMSITQEEFDNETSSIAVKKTEATMSSWFGNMYINLKTYERGKYLGMQKMKVENHCGEYRMTCESYNSENKLTGREESTSSRLPEKLSIER